jgi:hypothetical protein
MTERARREWTDFCESAAADVKVFSPNVASKLARALTDRLIDELRKDSSLPERTHFAWALVLGDFHRKLEDELLELSGLVNFYDTIEAIAGALVGDDPPPLETISEGAAP